MRILFAGTPAFAAAHLEALLASGRHQLLAVYTQPDRPAGRGKKTLASPVKKIAASAGLPVEQPASLKTAAAQQQLASFAADVMVVVAYGLLLPKAVLASPRLGCINVHASLLPRWRGAAPVERAIEAGDRESGVTIMQMDEGLDTGAMLQRNAVELAADETGDSLRARLIAVGAPALLQVLAQLETDTAVATVQEDALANYAHKLDKHEARLDFKQGAAQLERRIRAFTSAQPCFAELQGQRIKLFSPRSLAPDRDAAPGEILGADSHALTIACGEGALAIGAVQLPGGKPMDMAALCNGRPGFFRVGQCFDSHA
ncbi:MAG: methionyl-tRNA formyltransferase [Pseudomonadales bacterium]